MTRLRNLVGMVLVSFFAMMNTSSAGPECRTQQYSGGCIQVITYAINPETGTCCVYPNPCVVPDGWPTSHSGCEDIQLPLCSEVHGTPCSPNGATKYCKDGMCLCTDGLWDCEY